MFSLTVESQVERFLERFYSFGDAVLRSVRVDLRSSQSLHPASAIIEVSKQDADGSGKWVNVLLHVEGLEVCHVNQRCAHDIDILYDGLSIARRDGMWLVGSRESDVKAGRTPADDSAMFFTGHSLRWELLPYRE